MPQNKQHLVKAVEASGHGFTPREAEAAVDAVLAGISSLAAKDRLTLRGFGAFETRTRAARPGRNPRTGETIELPASTSLAFRAARQAS